MKTLKDSNGFSALHALLALFVVGVIGFTGWYVYQHNNKESTLDQSVSRQTKADTQSTKSNTSNIVLGKTFSMEGGAYSFKYPSDWNNITDSRRTTPHVSLIPKSLQEKYATDSRLTSWGLLSVGATYYTGSPEDYISNSAVKRKLEYQAIPLASSKVGYSAYKGSEMTQSVADKTYSAREYEIFHNGTLVHLTVYTGVPTTPDANGDLSEYEPIISEIIKSFVISDTQVRLPGQCPPGQECG